MMNLKQYALMAVTAVLSLTSCSKKEKTPLDIERELQGQQAADYITAKTDSIEFTMGKRTCGDRNIVPLYLPQIAEQAAKKFNTKNVKISAKFFCRNGEERVDVTASDIKGNSTEFRNGRKSGCN